MTSAIQRKYLTRIAAVWLCALVGAWAVPALAAQAPPPPTPPAPQPMILIPPPAAIQFQQSMQQQQVRSQLQQRQLESDLHRQVTEQATRPLNATSRNRIQLQQAEQAQSARNQAAQQHLVDQYWGIGVTPSSSRLQPARPRSGH